MLPSLGSGEDATGAFHANEEYEKALEQYRKAAENNYIAAIGTIGKYYYYGYGIEKDETQAVAWFRKAAEQGDAIARHNLGFMYDNGFGVEIRIFAVGSYN